MIPETTDASGGGVLYAAGAGLVALAMGVRYMLTQWRQGSADAHRAEAEIDVITSLRDEVKRLGEQNDALSARLNEMQLQSVSLRDEIGELRVENGRLRREITELHREIERLRSINDGVSEK